MSFVFLFNSNHFNNKHISKKKKRFHKISFFKFRKICEYSTQIIQTRAHLLTFYDFHRFLQKRNAIKTKTISCNLRSMRSRHMWYACMIERNYCRFSILKMQNFFFQPTSTYTKCFWKSSRFSNLKMKELNCVLCWRALFYSNKWIFFFLFFKIIMHKWTFMYGLVFNEWIKRSP